MDLEKGKQTPLFPINQNPEVSEDGKPAAPTLPPLMVSVGEEDFLVTTGTRLQDPAIGMFVDLNGDPVRGTLMFSTYPRSMGMVQSLLVNKSDHLSSCLCGDAEFRCRDTLC